MFRRYRAIGLALIAGCMTEKRFEQRYAEEFCALLSDCGGLEMRGYASARDCEAQQSAAVAVCDNFASDQASDCIDDLSQRTCDQAFDQVAPRSCSMVCD